MIRQEASMQDKADQLHREQLTGWPALGKNWEKLDAARIRCFDQDGWSVRVQFNPERIVSSAAKVDSQSIGKRPCFLCHANRPPEEDHVPFGNDYEILCNPFPIFRKHFTIASVEHRPQVIDTEFGRMLDMSRELPELVVFYNAPSCGASAPDHMHFQAGNRGFMPVEDEIGGPLSRHGRKLRAREGLGLSAVDDGMRRFLVMESERASLLEEAFRGVSEFMRARRHGEEPMLNMLAYYHSQWQILVFPREVHRPWQYFEEGERNILLSPAAVDMGGMLITPLEKDFNKISEADIKDSFHQVMLSEKDFRALTEHLEASCL